MREYINRLHPDQLDCDVTVEMDDEAYAAEFRILNTDNTLGLEGNHPVIFIPLRQEQLRATAKDLQEHFDAIEKDNGFGPVKD